MFYSLIELPLIRPQRQSAAITEAAHRTATQITIETTKEAGSILVQLYYNDINILLFCFAVFLI